MEYICLDIECTGLDNKNDQIIEIAAAKFSDNQIIEQWQSFIAHEVPIPENIQILTGITPDMTQGAPSLQSVQAELQAFIGDRPIIGHNINFDLDFLDQNQITLKNLRVDTLPLSEMVLCAQSYSLEMLSKNFNQQYYPSHRALDDVLANIELFWTIQKQFQQLKAHNQNLLHLVLDREDSLQNIILQQLAPASKEPIAKSTYQLDQFQPSAQTNQQASSPQCISQIPAQIPSTLFVLDPHQIHNFKQHSAQLIHSENSLISQDLFLSQHHLHQDWILKAKIATKLNPKAPCYIPDLQLRNAEFNEVHHYTEAGFQIETAQNYKINYHNFFKLIKNGIYPKVENTIIYDEPYFVEEFIKSQEHHLYPKEIQNSELQTAFQQFVSQNFDQSSYFISHHLVNDLFLKNHQDLVNMIQACLTNQKLALSDLANYLISICVSKHKSASIKLIDKSLKLNRLAIYNLIPSKFEIYKPAILNPLNLKIIKHNDEYQDILAHFMPDIQKLQNQEGLLILSTNLNQIKSIYCELHQTLKNNNYTLLGQNQSGSKSKILETIANNQKPYILICTHHFFAKFKPELTNLKAAFLSKLPIGLPHHYYYNYLKEQDKNSFLNLTLPHCAYTISQLAEQLHHLHQLDTLTLLDDRMQSTSWGQHIYTKLPDYIHVT